MDLTIIQKLARMPLYESLWYLFIHGGWILFLIIFLWGMKELWMYWRETVFDSKQSYVFLAIDIPRLIEQSPKAVENIFAALAGAHNDPNLKEKYIDGYFQVGYSMEIVSIDGFVQYVVRTPVKFRELVEAAIYAQYPDAELTEVNDYATPVKVKFPDEEYNLWGADIQLVKPYYYPIRTYPEFEHQMTQELKDPLAALLEIMNRIGKGEQLWFQILIVPVLGKDWVAPAIKEMNKILGIKTEVKQTLLDKALTAPLTILQAAGEMLVGGEAGEKKEEKRDPNIMAYLPPDKKAQVEGIGRKTSKIAYKTKMRFVYFGRKEVFKKGLAVSGMFGALKQFNTEDLNSMKPRKETKTVPPYIFPKKRMGKKQNRILELYKSRSMDSFGDAFYMNIEELASLWHFPTIETKAPLVQKIDSKKAGAPMKLPTEMMEERPILGTPIISGKKKQKVGKSKAKFEPLIDFATDDFEKRFAVDKTGQTTAARKKLIKEKYKIEETENEEAIDENIFQKETPSDLIDQKFSINEEKNEAPVKRDKNDSDFGAPNNLPFVE